MEDLQTKSSIPPLSAAGEFGSGPLRLLSSGRLGFRLIQEEGSGTEGGPPHGSRWGGGGGVGQGEFSCGIAVAQELHDTSV